MLRLLKRLNETGALFRAKRQDKVIYVEEFAQTILAQLGSDNRNTE